MTSSVRYGSEVLTVPPGASLKSVADALADYAVGCVVVVGEGREPLGVLTDRDLLCRVVAAGRAPEDLTAGDVMTAPAISAAPDEPLEVLAERMRAAAVRRLPIVRDGAIAGIVTLDDLLVSLGHDLDDLAEAARREVLEARDGAERRRRRGWRRELEGRLRELVDQIEDRGEQAREALHREVAALVDRVRSRWGSGPPGEP